MQQVTKTYSLMKTAREMIW